MHTSRSRSLLLAVVLGCCTVAATCTREPEGPAERPAPDALPRLTVVLVVDQMRGDFIERFRSGFEGGLHRLVDEGARFTDAHQDHAFTLTGAGHGTIPTGNHPRKNGVVGNSWWDREATDWVYAAADPSASVLGLDDAAGRSPVNLQSSTLGEWLKKSHPDAKVISVSLKDRSAITMGGPSADEVYWYDNDSGAFVTSSFYAESYPRWLKAFNAKKPADVFFKRGWSRLLPEEAYSASREDAAPYEHDGERTTFPHSFARFEEPGSAYYAALRYSPYADHVLLDLALEAVNRLELGRDDAPDLLFVGTSSADGVGHVFGPHSHEVQDYYLRLDRKLASWFDDLDKTVGVDRWSLVLTSDHGVLPFPEWLASVGVDARRVPSAELIKPAQEILKRVREELNIEPPLELASGNGLVLLAPEGGVDAAQFRAVRSRMAEGLRELEIVEDVFTYDELAQAAAPDRPFGERYYNSFHPQRTADLMIRVRPNYLVADGRSTSHGSPYDYDTHVPLIFWGPRFSTGVQEGRARTVDLAPTLARALRLEIPDGIDGRVLDAALAR